jgi:hypothetical protein
MVSAHVVATLPAVGVSSVSSWCSVSPIGAGLALAKAALVDLPKMFR